MQITRIELDTTYFYQIAAANGATASGIQSFPTARKAGDSKPFSIAILNNMGYTNAASTMRELQNAVSNGIAFAWHGGDTTTTTTPTYHLAYHPMVHDLSVHRYSNVQLSYNMHLKIGYLKFEYGCLT